MAIGESEVGRKSLGDVHGSVGVAHQNPLKRLFAFLGPAYLVSVGYMDPGNWATDLEGGARFGYALLWVLLMSNLMAVVLRALSTQVRCGHRVRPGPGLPLRVFPADQLRTLGPGRGGHRRL